MSRFSEYAQSASFRLELSKPMINVLVALNTKNKANMFDGGLNMHPYFALERRGLIEWRETAGRRHGPYVTKAGKKVFELLQVAGIAEEVAPKRVKHGR